MDHWKPDVRPGVRGSTSPAKHVAFILPVGDKKDIKTFVSNSILNQFTYFITKQH